MRVVVAEDEALIRLDLVEMLTEAGYDVVGQVGDGAAAVELARTASAGLVLLDIKMPVLDGISAAEQITAEGLAAVVLLTAFSDRDLIERARDAGAMAYVVKPFTLADLEPAIVLARGRFEQLQALRGEVADLTEQLETRKLLDRAKGLLMRQLNMSEPQAFRWIQKAAMDRRMGMKEVAQAVIAGHPARGKDG